MSPNGVSSLFGPRLHNRPVLSETGDLFNCLLQVVFQFRRVYQRKKIVRIDVPDQDAIWYLMVTKSACYLCLQEALDCISCKIICARRHVVLDKKFSFLQTRSGYLLQ